MTPLTIRCRSAAIVETMLLLRKTSRKSTLSGIVALAGLALLTSCGGQAKSSNDTVKSANETSVSAAAGTEPVAVTEPVAATTAAPTAAVGTELKAGPPPAKWKDSSGENEPFDAPVLREGVGAAAINCPEPPQPGVSKQCTGHVDEGGAYSMQWAKKDGAYETTQIWCQTPDDPKDFESFWAIEGKLIASGPGASDGQGRFFESRAIEDGDGIHWYVIRRPKGSACPAVWDLGAGSAIGASASIGGATFPLTAGPLCVLLSPAGLVVKPGSSDGVCV